MSRRSIIEIDHDAAWVTPASAAKINDFIRSGDQSHLPPWVKLIAIGHHTDHLAEHTAAALGASE